MALDWHGPIPGARAGALCAEAFGGAFPLRPTAADWWREPDHLREGTMQCKMVAAILSVLLVPGGDRSVAGRRRQGLAETQPDRPRSHLAACRSARGVGLGPNWSGATPARPAPLEPQGQGRTGRVARRPNHGPPDIAGHCAVCDTLWHKLRRVPRFERAGSWRDRPWTDAIAGAGRSSGANVHGGRRISTLDGLGGWRAFLAPACPPSRTSSIMTIHGRSSPK